MGQSRDETSIPLTIDTGMTDSSAEESTQSPSSGKPSPPRTPLITEKGVVSNSHAAVNPESTDHKRTIELATDQSIAARNLLYHPNESSLTVMVRCAEGINSVMARLNHTNDTAANLAKDEILISMCTRLMADGGTGRILGFNEKLATISDKNKETPKPEDYAALVTSLATTCRENMTNITTNARKDGPEGALARQGILSFMGDLGGLEKKETGFGSAYKPPLCDPQIVYNTYVSGLCDAQLKLNGHTEPATDVEVEAFEKAFEAARQATSLKGGSLSAPAHTAGKKIERAPKSWEVVERIGLLNTGDIAEAKLKEANPRHEKSLVNAAWPSYVVSSELTEDVVEPVTGHVSGTFGEMAVTMNLFCGTPPVSITQDEPSGTPISSAQEDQVISIAALSAAGLITAGFHSAVEVFQPMSTFCSKATHGSMGPAAVCETEAHETALRTYAEELERIGEADRPTEWGQEWAFNEKTAVFKLSKEELASTKEQLLARAEGLKNFGTKSTDMIALLQGGGTIATLEVSSVLAHQSSDPKVPLQLFSLNTRLEELGQRGSSAELTLARAIATQPYSEEQQKNLKDAIYAAEISADNRARERTTPLLTSQPSTTMPDNVLAKSTTDTGFKSTKEAQMRIKNDLKTMVAEGTKPQVPKQDDTPSLSSTK